MQMRLFTSENPSVHAVPEESSLLSTISRATGWFNPFNYSPKRIRNVLCASMLLMQAGVAKAQCFLNPKGDLFDIDCSIKDYPDFVKIITTSCQLTQLNLRDCGSSYISSLTKNYGHGFFGGVLCTLYSYKHPDSCIQDNLAARVHDEYGSVTDGVTVLSLMAVGSLTIASAGTLIFYLKYISKTPCQRPTCIDDLREKIIEISKPEAQPIVPSDQPKNYGSIQSAPTLFVDRTTGGGSSTPYQDLALDVEPSDREADHMTLEDTSRSCWRFW